MKSSLSQKLNLEGALTPQLLHAPANLENELPGAQRIESCEEVVEGNDWLMAFYADELTLAHELPVIKAKLSASGTVWLCWPKHSSGVASDLSDNVVRSIGLACALVDIKVAAINEIWSGLKFVFKKTS